MRAHILGPEFSRNVSAEQVCYATAHPMAMPITLWLNHFRALTSRQRHAFLACMLGLVSHSMHLPDFFILIFCVSAIAKDFHAGVPAVTQAIFLTLAFRPVGALLFGAMADRYGRRPRLMMNIGCFWVVELAGAFAPSLHVLRLILRALFGIAMGGEWGVGAALALESLPKEGRGFFSGLLQEGYALGYLLAAVSYGLLFIHIGWRGMFTLWDAAPGRAGGVYRSQGARGVSGSGRRAGQSREATRQRTGTASAIICGAMGSPFSFSSLLMTGFNAFSHGTQGPLSDAFLQ